MDNAKARKKEAKARLKAEKAKSKPVSQSDSAERSASAAERNARLRTWQLAVAALVGLAVIVGVALQALKTFGYLGP